MFSTKTIISLGLGGVFALTTLFFRTWFDGVNATAQELQSVKLTVGTMKEHQSEREILNNERFRTLFEQLASINTKLDRILDRK